MSTEQHASDSDLQEIMDRAMEAKVSTITGETTLLPDSNPNIILFSCGKCPRCKALEELVEGLGVGRVIDYQSVEAKELIAGIKDVFDLTKYELGLIDDLGHPLLLANGAVQFQFSLTPTPTTEEIFTEWYEFYYGTDLEAV